VDSESAHRVPRLQKESVSDPHYDCAKPLTLTEKIVIRIFLVVGTKDRLEQFNLKEQMGGPTLNS